MLLVLLALGIFASPLTASLAGFRPPWFVPYLLWLFLIVAAAFLARHDDDR